MMSTYLDYIHLQVQNRQIKNWFTLSEENYPKKICQQELPSTGGHSFNLIFFDWPIGLDWLKFELVGLVESVYLKGIVWSCFVLFFFFKKEMAISYIILQIGLFFFRSFEMRLFMIFLFLFFFTFQKGFVGVVLS